VEPCPTSLYQGRGRILNIYLLGSLAAIIREPERPGRYSHYRNKVREMAGIVYERVVAGPSQGPVVTALAQLSGFDLEIERVEK